jgi:hypothetical protein
MAAHASVRNHPGPAGHEQKTGRGDPTRYTAWSRYGVSTHSQLCHMLTPEAWMTRQKERLESTRERLKTISSRFPRLNTSFITARVTASQSVQDFDSPADDTMSVSTGPPVSTAPDPSFTKQATEDTVAISGSAVTPIPPKLDVSSTPDKPDEAINQSEADTTFHETKADITIDETKADTAANEPTQNMTKADSSIDWSRL